MAQQQETGQREGLGPRGCLAPICRASVGQAGGVHEVGGGEEMRINTSEQRGKGRGAAASAPWQPMKGSDTMRNVFPSARPCAWGWEAEP